jgi:hypothetical protein
MTKQKQHLIDMIKADEELGLYEEPTKIERIEVVIKYYYDRGTNRERVNQIKRKLLKNGK